jgi:hypothetical protein
VKAFGQFPCISYWNLEILENRWVNNKNRSLRGGYLAIRVVARAYNSGVFPFQPSNPDGYVARRRGGGSEVFPLWPSNPGPGG